MTDESFSYNLFEIKSEVQKSIAESSRRGLLHTTKWLCEINYALKDVKQEDSKLQHSHSIDIEESSEFDIYSLAKSYFDVREYDRCAYFSESCKSYCGKFLHLYSRYLSIDVKRVEKSDEVGTGKLASIAGELRRERTKGSLDTYLLYLYGLILKKLDLQDDARVVLCEAIIKEPMNWGAWLQLASLIPDRAKLKCLNIPDHWMKQFFLGHVYVELQLIDEAIQVYTDLQKAGFQESTYILAQIAIALHNKREVDKSIEYFRELRKQDPYRLDNLDTFSNLLYVKELRVELANLAQHAVEVDKYRVDTCCLIANYYGLRGEHQKAVIYFQRALKLNPQYLTAWTLMGHEYMEMKNTNAAIQSYRHAVEVNRRDYRAWYGLGQAYEILKLPFYACFYYKEAQVLKPNDARMLIALGEIYEKLDRMHDAVKCFQKATDVGDYEKNALLKLAKLYERLGETTEATTAFTKYVTEMEADDSYKGDTSDMCHAYKYLANTHLKFNRREEAAIFAQKCLAYEETKEEGKALLITLAQKNGQDEDKIMQVEDDPSDSRGSQFFRHLNLNAP